MKNKDYIRGFLRHLALQLNKRMKPGFIDHIGIRFGLGLMNESDFGTDKSN